MQWWPIDEVLQEPMISFAVEVAKPLMAAVLVLLAERVTRLLPARRLLRIGDRQSLVVVASNTVDKQARQYVIRATGVGQLRAFGALMPLLHRAYGRRMNMTVLLSSEAAGEHLGRDLLLLGGPARNAITKRMFQELGDASPLQQWHSIEHGGDRLYWKETDGTETEHIGPVDSETGSVLFDYCGVVSAPNPFNPRRRCIIVSGTRTFGTDAAAIWLSRQVWNWRIQVSPLSRPVIERYLAQRRAAGYVEDRSMKALRPLREFLAPLGVLPVPPEIPPGPVRHRPTP